MIFIFTIVNFEEKHGGIKIIVVRDRDSGTLNNGQRCPLFSLPPPPPAPGKCVINILHDNSFEEYSALTTRFAFIFLTCFSSQLTILCALRFSRKYFTRKVFIVLPRGAGLTFALCLRRGLRSLWAHNSTDLINVFNLFKFYQGAPEIKIWRYSP